MANDPIITPTVANNPVTLPFDIVNATAGQTSQIATGDPTREGLILKGNTYSPTAIQPNAAPDVTLNAWFKANAIVGLVDGQGLPSWSNSVVGANAATAVVAATYKTNIINGLPVVRFGNGTNKRYTTGISVTNPFTAMIVQQSAANASNSTLIQGSATYIQLLGTTRYIYMDTGSGITGNVAAGAGWTIVTVVFNGASSKAYINGVQAAAGNTGAGNLTNLVLSGANPAEQQGDMAEIILYAGAISESTRLGLEAGLSAKYAISVASQIPQAAYLLDNQWSDGTTLSGVDGSGRYVHVTTAGAPTGTAANGTMVYDTVNDNLYVYNSGWKKVVLG